MFLTLPDHHPVVFLNLPAHPPAIKLSSRSQRRHALLAGKAEDLYKGV
jgi:hypothetical protein